MKSFTSKIALLAAVATAAPLEKRQSGPSDADILNYALTLEHLEATFYRVRAHQLRLIDEPSR